jgi:hypothetical protein
MIFARDRFSESLALFMLLIYSAPTSQNEDTAIWAEPGHFQQPVPSHLGILC